jgi:hypothetical protein
MPKKESVEDNSDRSPNTTKHIQHRKKNGKPGLKYQQRIKAR